MFWYYFDARVDEKHVKEYGNVMNPNMFASSGNIDGPVNTHWSTLSQHFIRRTEQSVAFLQAVDLATSYIAERIP